MIDTKEKIIAIISKHLDVEKDKVVDSAHFVDDLGADSLDTVELVMELEDEFGVDIPDEDAEKITTVVSAVNYIMEHSKKD